MRRLEKLDVDPIAIAASPNRFNDIYWSDWRAIRFGDFFTERHDYGGYRDYEGDLRNGPSGARAARHTLDRLEEYRLAGSLCGRLGRVLERPGIGAGPAGRSALARIQRFEF